MKFMMVNTPPNARGEQLRLMASPGVSWAQFGDQVLFYADDTEAEDLAKRAGREGRRLQAYSAPAKTEHMYIVVQNGRLFQQEHPDVPVIVDAAAFSSPCQPTCEAHRAWRAPPAEMACGVRQEKRAAP
jgi:hypothetical protein